MSDNVVLGDFEHSNSTKFIKVMMLSSSNGNSRLLKALLEICKVSGVDDFIGSHPKGYDLEIRERGIGLSGGQKQTINLARSLIHRPAILLLDEPTSSMDQGTEQKVIGSLRQFCEDKTMLIVTHRNPILAMVDRVLVMENGNIITDQTPEKLGIKKVSK